MTKILDTAKTVIYVAVAAQAAYGLVTLGVETVIVVKDKLKKK